jgi:flagellar hook-length control protein FliK
MQFLPTFIQPNGGETGAKSGFGATRERAGASSFTELLQHASTAAGSLGRDQVRGMLDAKASSLSAEGQDALAKARSLLAKAGAGSAADAETASGEGGGRTKKIMNALLTAVGGSGSRADLNMQNLTLTREDFAGLREGLAKYGFTTAELDELQAQVNSKGGLAWGRLVSATARKMAGLDAFPQELSLDDARSIQSFFQKAGCTPQEAEDLLAKLRKGETSAVWSALEGKLAALSEDSTLDLAASEVEALCKALRLDSSQQGRLRAAIQEDGSANLAIKDLKAVLAELKTDAARQAEATASTATALRDLVAAAYESARDKGVETANSDRRQSDEARRARLLAEAAKDERKAEEENRDPLSGKRLDQENESRGLASRLPGAGRSRLAQEGGGEKDGGGRKAGEGRQQGEQAGAESAKADSRTEDQKAWAEFWGKVAKDRAGSAEVRAESKASAGENLSASGTAAAAALKGEAAQTATASLEKFAPREVLRQVESGIYKNLNEGAKQLTLRLDPPELGKLNLQLTVRGQEVSVVLKAENADAGRMLQENLHQLRQTLEDQGLKVGKMEVQTQLSDGNSGQGWSGADRHNEARERDETARALDRMRLLRGGDGVVQEMQTGDLKAIHSHAGLSVIA